MKPSIYGLDLEETEKLIEAQKLPRYRAKQILEWFYRRNPQGWEDAGNLPRNLRRALGERYSLSSLRLAERLTSVSQESVKFLFQTCDGKFLESVLISQRDRRTVCVSTQIGCKIGCIFCASGQGGFERNLTAGEIVEQVVWIERSIQSYRGGAPRSPEGESAFSMTNHDGGRITNVVFMGMGEPLDNFEAVMKALKILQASWGFGLGARRITVSTVGITPKVLEFVRQSKGRVRLSVSLHSSDDSKRTRLVPINRRYSLRELIQVLRQIHRRLKREITFEYTLIRGVNDSRDEANGVIRLARPLHAKVNLIPYNPIHDAGWQSPTVQEVEKFR
ncbi:MAG: 23S rRNA (adenine(2503)-C(2))-methyltransferase RlmN, partial [Candidatus Omnitrophica bacterium]|nr:23S rRNA (adenine(2503)-C(2))-methyltransferase RlmN [Candidatus Omnitrophota bacterium]